MRKLERSLLLPFSAPQLYRLVGDVESYPQFLPGCTSARVESREILPEGEILRAAVGFRVRGFSDRFASENRMRTDRSIEMRLLEGPFKSLAGSWDFQALGESGCKVSLRLSLEFGNKLLQASLAPWLDRAVASIMDAFRMRAEQLYGRR